MRPKEISLLILTLYGPVRTWSLCDLPRIGPRILRRSRRRVAWTPFEYHARLAGQKISAWDAATL